MTDPTSHSPRLMEAPAVTATLDHIGAEMRGGSDGPGHVGPAVLPLLAPMPGPGARVLIAGPVDDALVSGLRRDGYEVSVQLRSLEDAEAAAARLPAGVRVACGSLQRIGERFDVVVALGGLDHLAGADAPIEDWPAALDILAGTVADGGLLAAIVRNDLGIGRLTTADITATHRDDAFAGSHADVVRWLSRTGLAAEAEIALFPDTADPTVLVHGSLFGPADSTLAALVGGAYRTAETDPALLSDPRRLARDSVRHGLGLELAPGWLIVARRPDGVTAARPATETPVAGVVLTDPEHRAFGSIPQVVTRSADGSWSRARLPGGAPPRLTHATIARRPELLDGRLPTGQSFEELLLRATGRHDMLELRELLGRYARWLGVTTDWLDGTAGPARDCPPERVFGVPDNLVDDGADLSCFDPSWRVIAPVRADVAFLCGLRRFAGRVLAGARPHPWVSYQSPDRLAARLATMVGLAATEADLDAAAELDVAASALLGAVAVPLTAAAIAAHPVIVPIVATDTEAADPDLVLGPEVGPVDPVGPTAHPRGYAEAIRSTTLVSAELAAAHEQIRFLSAVVIERDARLAKAKKELKRLRNSRTYRVALVLAVPVGAGLRAARKVVRHARGAKK